MKYLAVTTLFVMLLGLSGGEASVPGPEAILSWSQDCVQENLGRSPDGPERLYVNLPASLDAREVSFEIIWSPWGLCSPSYVLVSSPKLTGCCWVGGPEGGAQVNQIGTSWKIRMSERPAQADEICLTYSFGPGEVGVGGMTSSQIAERLPVDSLDPRLAGTFCLRSVEATDSSGEARVIESPNVATILGGRSEQLRKSTSIDGPLGFAADDASGQSTRNVDAQVHTNALYQNSPNPFVGTSGTEIRFSVGEPTVVEIRIFDTAGRLVNTIVSKCDPGENSVSWSGRSSDGLQVPCGVYFYEMKTGFYVSHKKMMLVK